MTTPSQRQLFLECEGDARFQRHHDNRAYTVDPQEWVAATVLRRFDFVFGQA